MTIRLSLPMPAFLACFSALLSACAAPVRPLGSGASLPGSPHPAVGSVALDRADPPVPNSSRGAASDAVHLPDRITLPAAYRVMLLDGHLALVREADEEALKPGTASLRVVTGEIARGELAYQPALLPQELAAELAANRESAARMEDALEGVLKRSRELSDQARELAEQNRRLGSLLEAAENRVRQLDAQKTASGTDH